MAQLRAGFVTHTERDSHGRAMWVMFSHRRFGVLKITPRTYSIQALHEMGIPLPDAFDLGIE